MKFSLLLISVALMAAPALTHAQKTAQTLSDLCNSDSMQDRSRCLGYIQGYLEGVHSSQPAAATEPATWTERAMQTRLVHRANSMADTPELCVSGESAAARVKALIRETREQSEGNAAAWLRTLSQQEFPC